MKQIFFILNARAGTNLWKFLAGRQTVGFWASKAMREIRKGELTTNPDGEKLWFLPTTPVGVCPCDVIKNRLTTELKFDYHAWWMAHGDWWGHARSATVPGPYDLPCETRYGPDELKMYEGDCTFIYMIRDGRNQIESLLNLPGGFESERFAEDPQDYFEVVCKAWRNRARIALDCREQMENFKLFHFEDFVSNPADTMSNMLEFVGLTADQDFIRRAHDLLTERNIVEQHSSFRTLNKLNQRWKSWEEWQKETFNKIAGKELVDLDYEKDNNWS